MVVDKDNKMISMEYAEVIISGNLRTWVEWWPLAEFLRNNPMVVI
jgi:hypothetical protein